MTYSELINQVFDAFYANDKDFPQDMLFPILRRDDRGNVVDMFIACNVDRNPSNGKVEKIEKIEEIFFNGVSVKLNEFVTLSASNEEFAFDFSKLNKDVSIKEFISLYLKTREFVFNDDLTVEQISVLKSLITIYENLFEETVKEVYHKYAYDFYKWAYKFVNG